MSAALALQKAVFEALSASPALLTALGGNRIYDEVPTNAGPVSYTHLTLPTTPYV
jgi:hypothetical protein